MIAFDNKTLQNFMSSFFQGYSMTCKYLDYRMNSSATRRTKFNDQDFGKHFDNKSTFPVIWLLTYH